MYYVTSSGIRFRHIFRLFPIQIGRHLLVPSLVLSVSLVMWIGGEHVWDVNLSGKPAYAVEQVSEEHVTRSRNGGERGNSNDPLP
jgi:hypothetical protein